MEEGMDPRRGPPLLGGNHWASTDMNFQLGSSSGGSGSSNMVNRMARLEEAGESSTGGSVGNHDTGKGPESSRPPVRKPSQLSPKLVAARSSGGRRVQRPHHGSLQGRWNVLHSFADGLNEAGSETVGIDGDGNLGMGLGTHLGLSEEIIVHPAHVQSLSNSEFLGRSSRPGTNTLDFLSGRMQMQGNTVSDYFEGRTGGRDNLSGRTGASGLPPIADAGVAISGGRNGLQERPLDGVGGSMTFNSLFMDQQDLQDGGRSVLEERRVENGAGSMMSNSLFMERLNYQDETQWQGTSSNFMGAAETFLAGSSRNQGLFDDAVGCTADDPHYGAERHSLRGSLGGTSSENCAGSYGHGSSSSRSSACKRKSCTPVVAGSLSCRSGSPHRTGFRENYSGRAGGGNGLSRRTTGIGGCTSASEIVASTSSPSENTSMGRCSEPPAAASRLEEPLSRRTNFVREPVDASLESIHEGQYGKSVAGSSSASANSQRSTRTAGVGVVLTDSGTAQPSPPFSRTVRRAMPSHDNVPRRTSLSDSSMDADEGIVSSSLLVDQMMSASQPRRSDSPLLGGGRSGASGSPRRTDATFGSNSLGERFTHRYLGNGTRGLATSASSASQLGAAVASESRLRSRGINHNLESMSQTAPSPSQPVPHTHQTAVRPASPSAPSPSRPPPHPPALRGRLQGSSVHTLLPPPPPSGPAPSRLPPSRPPLNPLSFAPSIDALPSPTSLFRGSLLPGSSPAGVRDRAFASAAESLLGMPFRGLQMSAGDGGPQPRLVAEGLAEILLALERVERDEDLTYEQFLMLEATLLFGGMGLHDQHSDLRLDVDNMSYEELLALEERIGNVSTGVTPDVVAQKLKKSHYSSLDAVVARFSQECDIKCSICQEEYEEGDELGKIDCGHGYHVLCIQQWLVQKNQCPICKAAAFS